MFAFYRMFQRSAVVLVIGLTTWPAFAGQLQSELAIIAEKSEVDLAGEMLMRFSLTNDTEEAIYFLTYQTPLAGLQNNLLLVEYEGEPVDYIGKLAFRVGPTVQDWLRLEPGETVVTVFDLFEHYDIREPGFYEVQYRALQHTMSVRSEDQLPVVTEAAIKSMRNIHDFALPADLEAVESNTVTMFMVGEIDPLRPKPGPIVPADSGCSSSRSNTARSAQATGVTQAYNAYFANQDSTSFFNRWFGRSFDTVQSNIARIYYRMRDRNFFYTCTSCGSGVVAYVYKGSPDRIWLCNAFWGYGSWFRASVILHETSHWYVTAGADDVVYGCSNAQNLSSYNKIRNADNYRCAGYYAP